MIKDGPGAYRMWMSSLPSLDGSFEDLVQHIYRFESADGIDWTRDPAPVVTFNERLRGTIYPFVMRDGGGLSCGTAAGMWTAKW